MAGWEEELAVLLSELGVKQEEPRSHLRSARKPIQSDVKPREQSEQHADTLFLRSMENRVRANSDDADDDLWLDDLDIMRHEVDSIVGQVVRLMQSGDLDTSLKEDVLVVLRALRRRANVTQQAAASEAAYLEFASAMLHFCRLVIQLSEFATEE